MTKPNEPSNEQEVLHNPVEAIDGIAPRKIDVLLRCLPKAPFRDMLVAEYVALEDTIAQLKEELAEERDVYAATNKALNHVVAELSASQEQVKMLRNTGAAVIDDLVIRAKLAEDDSLNISDSILQNFEKALAATAPAVSPDTKEG